MCRPLRALIFAKLSAVEDTPSPAAPPTRNAKSRLGKVFSPQVLLYTPGFPKQRHRHLKYPCIDRTGQSVPPERSFGGSPGSLYPSPPKGTQCFWTVRRFLLGATVKSIPDLPNHPTPVGPYSHCVVANGLVFISGQAPLRPQAKPGEWAAVDVGGQTRQCLRNIQSILQELGLDLGSVVRTTVFLANASDFKAMNEAYREFFPQEPPARSTARLGVDLPGLTVSIDAIAVYEPHRDE